MQVKKHVTGGGPILEKIRGQEVTGYEIHMGVTSSGGEIAFGDDGAVAENGIVIGTYLHGIFDNENFRDAFLDYLYERKNPCEPGSGRSPAPKGSGFQELAQAVEANLDLEKVWRMLGLD